MSMNASIKERLLNNIELITESGCWIWMGYVTKWGYGTISVDYKKKCTHRMAYQEMIGEIPKGMLVCHTCDVPSCINPNHLFVGTHQDNMDDMTKKGRGKWWGKASIKTNL